MTSKEHKFLKNWMKEEVKPTMRLLKAAIRARNHRLVNNHAKWLIATMQAMVQK